MASIPETKDESTLILGIPGFCYADLYDSARLADLLDTFDLDLKESDTGLHAEYQAYRATQGQDMTPQAIPICWCGWPRG